MYPLFMLTFAVRSVHWCNELSGEDEDEDEDLDVPEARLVLEMLAIEPNVPPSSGQSVLL
jgi:hypothetical protein